MAKLTGNQMRVLRKAMLDTFTTRGQWATLLQDANRNLDEVSLAENLEEIAQQVIVAANDQGWLADLLQVAADERSNLSPFQNLVTDLVRVLEADDLPQTEAETVADVALAQRDTSYELRDVLVDAYDDLLRAREIAQRAGIRRDTLPINAPDVRVWWWEAIEAAQRQGKLSALVDAAIADPTVAGLKPRFEALREPILRSLSQASVATHDTARAGGAADADRPAVPGSSGPRTPTVFISYSHKDAVWKDRLVTQLSVLEHVGLLQVWDDQRIEAGQDWEQEIEAAMSGAAVTVLMVSADFLTSKFIKTREIPRLLQRREQEGMRIIPVIVRPCLWQSVSWLSAMQARPKDGRPLAQGTRARYEADLTTIVREIADILRAVQMPQASTGVSEVVTSSATPAPVAPKLPSEEPDRNPPKMTGAIPKEPARVVEKPPISPAPPDTLTITEPIRMELVHVSAGKFLMGSDKIKDSQAYDDEAPQHTVNVAEFHIGKYPVTNAQYAAFAKAMGRKVASTGKDDHPVVNVSWQDAVDFTKWLSKQTSKSFRLPTEMEWEKAARGTDGRIYPWVVDWDPKKANTREGGPGWTTPVGQYSPGGDSPYGCADMAGNVWEWTSSLYRPYPYRPDDGREDPKAEGARVLRGGSYDSNPQSVRCAFRGRFYPGSGDVYGGFRVVASP